MEKYLKAGWIECKGIKGLNGNHVIGSVKWGGSLKAE